MSDYGDETDRKGRFFTRLFTYGPMCVFALVIILGLWDGREDAAVYGVVGFFIWVAGLLAGLANRGED